MSKFSFATRSLVTVVYIIGLIILTGIGVWDITNIIRDYTTDNRINTVKPINITGRFPFLLRSAKVRFYYPGQAIYPQRLEWDDLPPILSAGWRDQQTESDTSENASIWERSLRATVPHIYIYYIIGDIDKFGPDIGSNDSARLFSNEAFVNSMGISVSELRSNIDAYISSPAKLRQIKQSLDILQAYLGGVIPIKYDAILAGAKAYSYSAIISTAGSSPVPEEGCFRIQLSKRLTSEHGRYTYAYMLTTEDMKPYIPSVVFSFPEEIQIALRLDSVITVAISNMAVTDSRDFPPCTEKYETEEECLEDMTVKILVDTCQCAPLTRIADGSIDLSAPKHFCTTAAYKQCWTKAMKEVSRLQTEARREKTCTPCIAAKNLYSATIIDQTYKFYVPPTNLSLSVMNSTEQENHNFSSWPSPRIHINFVCPDRTYILLQDKQQYSLSQFISQIGGDLGLYIGFSMISFLEAVLFVYHMYHNRRGDAAAANLQTTPRRSNFGDGCRYFGNFLFRNFNTAQFSDETAIAHMESMQSQLQSIRNETRLEIQALEKSMQEKMRLYQSEISQELKRDIQKLNDRIGTIGDYKGRRGVWRT